MKNLKRDRLEQILQHIQAQGTVTTVELTRLFDVSEMTIRRDLMVLERQGKILRFHGGASMRKNENMEAAFEVRVNANQSCKKAIGAAAVAYLTEHLPDEPSGSVFLGSGSTIYCMATQMGTCPRAPIITDNTYVANTLAADPQNAVILIGGQLILPAVGTEVGPRFQHPAAAGADGLGALRLFAQQQVVRRHVQDPAQGGHLLQRGLGGPPLPVGHLEQRKPQLLGQLELGQSGPVPGRGDALS